MTKTGGIKSGKEQNLVTRGGGTLPPAKCATQAVTCICGPIHSTGFVPLVGRHLEHSWPTVGPALLFAYLLAGLTNVQMWAPMIKKIATEGPGIVLQDDYSYSLA